MSRVDLSHVWKIYPRGNVVGVKDLTFTINDKEFLAILGPSGGGKSSTLRMLAGLEEISKGEVSFDGRVVNHLGPAERNIALAFESYALYQRLSVYENIAFPLRARRMKNAQVHEKVTTIAKLLDLTDLLKKFPPSLAGGQQQRVSLARAFVRQPNLTLLDEPISHMDQRVRAEIRARIRHLHDEMKNTTVYVTHDQAEAVSLCDRMVIINRAELQQIGPVEEIWNRPVNRFVAFFVGEPSMNFLPARVERVSEDGAPGGGGSVAVGGAQGSHSLRFEGKLDPGYAGQDGHAGGPPPADQGAPAELGAGGAAGELAARHDPAGRVPGGDDHPHHLPGGGGGEGGGRGHRALRGRRERLAGDRGGDHPPLRRRHRRPAASGRAGGVSGILDLFRLEGKTGFVTGGARGIGRGIARGLAEAGARVAVLDLDLEGARAAAAEISAAGAECLALQADVTRREEVERAVGELAGRWGRLDIAVNNAGICRNVPAEQMSEADWDRVLEVNLKAVFLCAQAAGRRMIAQGSGSIINIGSMSAQIVNYPQPQVSYNAAKAGVVHLTRSLAAEWARHGVRVNCISPGYVNTELLQPARALHPQWLERTPQKRFGEPWEIAALAVYLASDASLYCTGSDLVIDGGYTLW